ncbi:MAG: insulinase family protein [Paramuribaculum sp.]|nr:insulinase family protein [Paramuribaculum sp.]
MNKSFLSFISALTIASSASAANPIPYDSEVKTGQLPCGLTYYIRHNENPAGCADFFLAQSIGSVNETDSQQGLAHFLEHICFNGTRHFPGNTLIDYLESVGVKFGRNLNAYTSTDETVYNICEVPVTNSNRLDSCLLILRDWSRDLSLDPNEIDAERGVIEGEWRQRMGAPTSRLLEKVLPVAYGTSIYGHRMPIGKMEIIRNFPPSELRSFYNKWCNPMNQCVIVTGDIDVNAVENKIKDLWSDVSLPSYAQKAIRQDIGVNTPIIAAVASDPEQAGSAVQIYIKYPAVDSADTNTVTELTEKMYGDIITSMLVDRFEQVERQPGIPFYNLGIGDSHFLLTRSQPALMLRANSAKGRETETIGLLSTELKRAATHGFTNTELQRALLNYRNNLDREFLNSKHLTNTDYARRYSRHFLDGGALPSAEAYYKIMKGLVSKTDTAKINRHFRNIIRPNDTGVVILTYVNETAPAPTDISQAYTKIDKSTLTPYIDIPVEGNLLEVSPAPGKIVSVEDNPIFNSKVMTLSNGIKVHLKPMPGKTDKVYIQGYSKGGLSQHYNPSQIADYRLLEDALSVSGCGKYSSSELRRRLASTDIRSTVNIGNMDEKIEISSPHTQLPTAFQLLYLKATSLTPDTIAYSTMIENHRLKLGSHATNPTFIMGDTIHYYVYNRHPLGGKLSGKDLESADYSSMLAIYNDRFKDMSDFTFYITGAFDIDSITPLVTTYIASLPGNGRTEQPLDINYGYASSLDKSFSCPMTLPQSISYSFYHSPCDYNLTNVLTATVAGNIIQNRLRKILREEKGWTYSVKSHCGLSAGYNGNSPSQLIMPVYIKLHPENVSSALIEIDNVLTALTDPANIDPIEISSQISQLEKNHRQAIEDPTYWLILMRAKDRFDQDMHTGYIETLHTITSEDISQFITKYILPAERLRLTMNPTN